MKKITIGFLLLLALCFIPTTSEAAANYVHSVTLRQGMSHPKVKILQAVLYDHGFPVSLSGAGSHGNETEYFGSKTKTALIAFQKSRGLTSDGIAGPKTGEALHNVYGISVYPDGCVSSEGFSITTGGPCSVVKNIPPMACPITSAPYEAFAKVLSPNGGEELLVFGDVKVTWMACGLASQVVSITILNTANSQIGAKLASKIENDGQEKITLPESLPAGDYKILVQTFNFSPLDNQSDPTLSDWSDKSFHLAVPTL